MKYESFDRNEIVDMQGEILRPGASYHKQNSTWQTGNFDRPICPVFSTSSMFSGVPHIDPSTLLRSLPDTLYRAALRAYQAVGLEQLLRTELELSSIFLSYEVNIWHI